jgi:hypothetical protein
MLLIGLAKPKLVCVNKQAQNRLLPKAALRPRMLLRALRPGEASLASVDVLSAPCVLFRSFRLARNLHTSTPAFWFFLHCILELATELLQAITGFTAFKRTAAFSVNGSMIWDSQR